MEKVVISDKKIFEKKFENLKKNGLNKLHVVSDFDWTLTKYHNSKSLFKPSTFSLTRVFKYLKNEEFVKKSREAYAKYGHKLHNFLLSEKERSDACKKLQEIQFENILSTDLSIKIFDEISNDFYNIFRDDSSSFFEILKDNKIPLTLMSAGLGDLIIKILEKNNYHADKVLGNFFNFDDNGIVLSIKEKVFVSKKSWGLVKNKSYINGKSNVLVLGDILEDLKMVDGLDYDNIITAGFLNNDISKNLEVFKKNFDMVIINTKEREDSSLKPIIDLLKKLK